MSPPTSILPFAPAHEAACAALIDALPEWFGLPDLNAGFVRDLSGSPSWVAVRDGAVVGAVTLRPCNDRAMEISFLGVRPELHRSGVGRALVRHAEAEARRRAARWMHVKTLGPSHPDPFYARTRAFYAAIGYDPLFETARLWGPDNPALILVRALSQEPEGASA